MDYTRGVNELINEVHEKYAAAILRYIWSRINDIEVSRELTNDTFTVAFKRYDVFKDVENKKRGCLKRRAYSS